MNLLEPSQCKSEFIFKEKQKKREKKKRKKSVKLDAVAVVCSGKGINQVLRVGFTALMAPRAVPTRRGLRRRSRALFLESSMGEQAGG